MADTGSNAAVSTPSQSANSGGGQTQPAANGQYNVPSGYRLVSDTDHAAYERTRQQAAGHQQYTERLKKLGFEKLEDLEAYEPALRTMRERKIDPVGFSRLYSPDADADLNGNGDGRQSQIDPKKLREELLGEVRAENAKFSAQREFDELTKKEQEHFDAVLREFVGDRKVDAMDSFLYRNAIENLSWQYRDAYPEKHPLAGMPGPFVEAKRGDLLKFLKDEQTKHKGAALAGKADAAIESQRRGTTSAAGRSGGGGATETKPRTPGQPQTEAQEREDIRKMATSLKERRAAGG